MSGFDINKLKSISKATMASVSKKEEKFSKDTRFWTIDRDPKTGNGVALIRFLPNLSETELPWVQTYDYFIKSPNGGWYVEKSLRTLGQNDPMREYIHSLWQNAQTEEQKKKFHTGDLKQMIKQEAVKLYEAKEAEFANSEQIREIELRDAEFEKTTSKKIKRFTVQ